MITLTTDLDQVYVAQMKGAMLALNPDARIVDIFHDVRRFDIRRASFAMMCSAKIFPKGTVHVCVVDPGVGSSRRGIIVDAGYAWFVGPDNGVFTLPLTLSDEFSVFAVDADEVTRRTGRSISRTFHGRDLFAPVAALIDLSKDLDQLGKRVESIVTFEVVDPAGSGRSATGTILFVDGFGNLVTNIPRNLLDPSTGSDLRIHLGGKTFPCTSASCYADGEPGQLILLVGSQGTYEISLNKGSAFSTIGGTEGDEIHIALED